MNIEEFCSVVERKENNSCELVPTASTYEGVFIKTDGSADQLLMVYRPIGKTREVLSYVAAEGSEFKDKNSLIGTPVELIQEIKFL